MGSFIARRPLLAAELVVYYFVLTPLYEVMTALGNASLAFYPAGAALTITRVDPRVF